MAYIRAKITVSRVTDTGFECEELTRTVNCSPLFTVWSILMIILGALSSVEN